MRARRFRPTVFGLDSRLLLSDVTTGLPNSGIVSSTSGTMPGDEIDLTTIITTDPGNTDPTDPSVPTDPTDPTTPSDPNAPGVTTTVQSTDATS